MNGDRRRATRAVAIGWAALVAVLAFAAPAVAEEATPPAAAGQGKESAVLFARHCTKCHTIGEGDRVGPDLKGVHERREHDWLVGFIGAPGRYLDSDPIAMALLEKYDGVRMRDLGITPEQSAGLVEYIRLASEGDLGGGPRVEPLLEREVAFEIDGPSERSGLWPAGIVLSVVLLAGAELARRSRAARTAQVVVVVGVALGYWSLGGQALHRLPGDDQGYAPVQPIPFSHALHAGEMRIACVYCHHAAEKGPEAGVPAVSICMNCHAVVTNRKGRPGDSRRKGATDAVSPALAPLLDVWASRETDAPRSIEWVRVHDLPDFVFFDHRVHVGNGIHCQECHGPVQTMERMRQASDLSMGWCINCHRHEGQPAPTHWQRSEGTLDCNACHQ